LGELLNDADRWEVGCKNDKVRNEFVIPETARLFHTLRPRSILDIGDATGFTARHIDEKLNYRPSWTLLDSDSERLALASVKCPVNMNFEIRRDNFLSIKPVERKFDALFFGFTLLEIGTGQDVLSQIDSLCAKKGVVVVAQPDVMQDVLASSESDSSLLGRFAAGSVSLRKTDKFTKVEYPFHADRFESVTYKVMQLGFSLERFAKESFDGRAVFLLAFVRQN
jgi:ubiquinone/menaquinone biosynthesis C-methylase UbiE